MRRRDFITLLIGTAAWPIVTRAQSSIPVIGFINGSSATAYATYVQAFIRGLAETGYILPGKMSQSNTAGPRGATSASRRWSTNLCAVV
jgi:hypothetical protein